MSMPICCSLLARHKCCVRANSGFRRPKEPSAALIADALSCYVPAGQVAAQWHMVVEECDPS